MPCLHPLSGAKEVCWAKAVSCYLSWSTGSLSLRAEMANHLKDIKMSLGPHHFQQRCPGQKILKSIWLWIYPFISTHSHWKQTFWLCELGTAEQGSRHGLSHTAVHPRCLCRSCPSHLPQPPHTKYSTQRCHEDSQPPYEGLLWTSSTHCLQLLRVW